jgi:hypothetical protein
MAQTLIDLLKSFFGDLPYGLDFLLYLLGGLLLIFMFHLLEHIFEILFSRFFK